ncbi:uncharacterized protein C9orf40 homolog isoform 2-T2 [Glossophaga mutica]
MAKRRAAEPLTFHVPWKRPLLCNFPEEPPPPPLWIPVAAESHPGQHLGVPDLPRKRKIDAGAMTEPSGSPSKRHDCWETNARGSAEGEGRGLETGEPSLLQQPPLRPNGPGEEPGGARPPRGGGDNGAGRAESPRGDWGAASRQNMLTKVCHRLIRRKCGNGSPMKSFGSITPSSTGGILYHLLIWQTLKV